MSQAISLREANHRFAEVIRAVESGERFVITRRGEAVAEIVPVRRKRVLTPEQEKALAELKEAMATGYELGGWTFTRDELYER